LAVAERRFLLAAAADENPLKSAAIAGFNRFDLGRKPLAPHRPIDILSTGVQVRDMIPTWLKWAREIQALSQTGLHYAQDEYQKERYRRLSEIAAEIIANEAGLPAHETLPLFLSQKGYATPKVDVRAAVFKEGKLLMVKERADGGWTLPGGWADVGDIPSLAAEREVLEESGFRVRARQVIGVYDANRSGPAEFFHAFKIIFLCDLLDGSPQPSIETSEVAFFSRSEIPQVLSGERTKLRHIEAAFAASENGGMPAEFD
jgi:ADP-ribose pyrophosphatase YjhB (NUDIX family)